MPLGPRPSDTCSGLCFCRHCLGAAHRHGVDGQAVRRFARAEGSSVSSRATPASDRPSWTSTLLGTGAGGELAGYLEAREETVTTLVAEVAGAARAGDGSSSSTSLVRSRGTRPGDRGRGGTVDLLAAGRRGRRRRGRLRRDLGDRVCGGTRSRSRRPRGLRRCRGLGDLPADAAGLRFSRICRRRSRSHGARPSARRLLPLRVHAAVRARPDPRGLDLSARPGTVRPRAVVDDEAPVDDHIGNPLREPARILVCRGVAHRLGIDTRRRRLPAPAAAAAVEGSRAAERAGRSSFRTASSSAGSPARGRTRRGSAGRCRTSADAAGHRRGFRRSRRWLRGVRHDRPHVLFVADVGDARDAQLLLDEEFADEVDRSGARLGRGVGDAAADQRFRSRVGGDDNDRPVDQDLVGTVRSLLLQLDPQLLARIIPPQPSERRGRAPSCIQLGRNACRWAGAGEGTGTCRA